MQSESFKPEPLSYTINLLLTLTLIVPQGGTLNNEFAKIIFWLRKGSRVLVLYRVHEAEAFLDASRFETVKNATTWCAKPMEMFCYTCLFDKKHWTCASVLPPNTQTREHLTHTMNASSQSNNLSIHTPTYNNPLITHPLPSHHASSVVNTLPRCLDEVQRGV